MTEGKNLVSLSECYGPVSLTLPASLSYDEWEDVGRTLSHVAKGVQWWVGDWLLYGERNYGEQYAQAMEVTKFAYGTVSDMHYVSRAVKFSLRNENLTWNHHKAVAPLPPAEQREWLDRAERNKWSYRELRAALADRKKQISAEAPPLPEGKFRCIVIDPPWPVAKIDRDERPNQGRQLDYATMSVEEITSELRGKLTQAAEDACHLYLWVTQKYLPDGLRMVEEWGFEYQCLMTWVKPTGMTPFSWMYNTEHVIYAHKGGLTLQKLGLKLSFDASVTRHSEKPEVFYDIVRQASPSPRLDMYQRIAHEGFIPWGAEAPTQEAA